MGCLSLSRTEKINAAMDSEAFVRSADVRADVRSADERSASVSSAGMEC